MSGSWAAFVEDPRSVCRYGTKCYQKNPEHHRTYKHPPNVKRNTHTPAKPATKRFKPSLEDETVKTASSNDNIESKKTQVNDEKKTESPVKEPGEDPKGELSPKRDDQNEPEPSTLIKLPDNLEYYKSDSDTNLLKELFLVEMPQDFFHFQKCLQEDKNFEKTLASVNLQLIGPFDLFLGKLPVLNDKELYLVHWRFFYDPPEFQAVLKRKGNSEYHIGYFRDDPKVTPVFLASNDSSKDCRVTPVADNIFAAVYLYLEKEKKSSPFISISCQRLQEKVKKWAEEYKYSVEPYNMKKRVSQSVTKTLHGAGIAVPYDRKTDVGYRKLAESDATLKKLFTRLDNSSSQREKDVILSELQPVITFANIAVDECDFGTGLEAGIDLFCSGLKELESSALGCLTSTYTLLNREAFVQIVQAHLKYRRKGPNMSILSSVQ